MSHKMLRPFIVKVSVLGYFPLAIFYYKYLNACLVKFKYHIQTLLT